jgi:hypothetical protein
LTLYAQPSSPPSIIFVTSDPAGACSLTVPLRFNTTNAKLWGCSGGTWTQIGSGGGGGGTIGGAVTGGTANYNLIVDGSSNLGQEQYLGAARFPALTGDVTTTAGSLATAIGAGKVTNTMLVGTDIATVGTITAGTWHGTVVSGLYGGTGTNNGSNTITLGNNLTTSGNFALTLTQTGTTNVTLPTSGTLLTTTGSGSGLSGIPTSITGTANQVTASASTGAVTLSLPQSIATTSSPQFANLGLGGAAAGGTANGLLYQFTGTSNSITNHIAGGTLSNSNTTITVTDTTGFPTSGYAWIKDGSSSEAVSYTGTTATTLTGATRGVLGTTAASHTTSAYVLPIESFSSTSSTVSPSMTTVRWGAISGAITLLGSLSNDQGIQSAGAGQLASSYIYGGTITTGSILTSSSTSANYIRAGGSTINVGDDKAYTINVNSSTGSTNLQGSGGVAITGLTTKYNNVSTAGIGTPPVYASAAQTGQTASIAATNLQCGGAVCPAGLYRVHVYTVVTTTGTGTLTTTIGWTDPGQAQTITSAGVATTAKNFEQLDYVIRADGVANITYATTLSVSGTYAIYVTLERLQ